jgi:hypothetical protein
MLRIIAARTFNLTLLDAAAGAKHGKTVARHYFAVLCASGGSEKYQIKGSRLSGEFSILLYSIFL